MKKIIIYIALITISVITGGCIQKNTAENKSDDQSNYSFAHEEQEQMFATAREYIAQYSVPGMKVDLKIIKQLDKWALLNVVPLNVETDEAGMIMEKVDDKWEARAFGTIFPEWEKKIPELFK